MKSDLVLPVEFMKHPSHESAGHPGVRKLKEADLSFAVHNVKRSVTGLGDLAFVDAALKSCRRFYFLPALHWWRSLGSSKYARHLAPSDTDTPLLVFALAHLNEHSAPLLRSLFGKRNLRLRLGLGKFALLVMVTTACYARSHFESKLGSWMGRTTSDLFDAWGPPTETFDLPDGRKMYTWSDTRGAQAVTIGHSTYAIPVGCKITFTVDTHNQVRDWRYQGNNCY